MKRIIVLLATLALIGCDTSGGGSGNEPNKSGDGGNTYAKELWGEWLRMDTGDKWYLSDNAVTINGVDASITASLNKQSERVIEVTDEGRKYYLYASRVANARFTGSVASIAGAARAIGGGSVRVAIANLGNKSNELSVVTNAEGVFTAEGIIPGDAYRVTPEGGTPVTVIPPNDGADVGVITVTGGVNFKTSISPAQPSMDMGELYINETYSFNIEFENVGDEDCPAPSYTIIAPNGVSITGNLQDILGTIEPGARKSVPINVRCSEIAGDYEYKKINVTIRDASGKTWEDSVSLRFYKETINFNIKAQESISGVVITPDAKMYSFTTITNGTLFLPWQTVGDYLVVFSGATIETETFYSLGIGAEADDDFASFFDTSVYEPNNTEGTTVAISEQRIMAYLYKNDIDYYRVSYSSVPFPAAPTNVSARVADAEVSVSWDAVSDAVSYNVYRSDGHEGTYAKVGTSAEPSYVDTVTAMGTYYYKVTAVNARNLESPYSTPKSAAVRAPAAPANVSTRVADAEVSVSWDAVSGANSYNVYRSRSQEGTYAKIGTSAEPSYSDTISVAGIYYYKIIAVSARGFESAYSVPTAAIVVGPATPTNVSARIADAEVSVSWGAASGASSYHVYRSDSQEGTYERVGTSAGASYIDTISVAGIYYYKVSAVSAGGVEGTRSTPTLAIVEIEVAALTDTLSEVAANAVDFTYYTLLLGRDETIPAQTLSYSGKTVMITLKGKDGKRTVNLSGNGSLFTVGDGVTLVVDDGVTLKGHSSNNASLVMVDSGGTLLLKDGGTISGNSVNGVYIYSSGTFEMSGGTISGNTASRGRGVRVDGTFKMSGGEISGNSDSGVFVYYGIFEMSGGTISGNTATYNGGGVYVSSGRFEMSGGEISGNTASSWGGGVYVEGTFIKQSGGTIYGSTASDSLKNTAGGDSYGHAVFVSSLSTKKRNTTAGVGVTLNSGSTGGWE